MECGGPCVEAGGNIPNPLATVQLCEDHAHELLSAPEMADSGFGIVALDQAEKRLSIHEVENSRKNEAPRVFQA